MCRGVKMCIRNEEEKDYLEIYNLVKTAFETAKVSDGDEQDFVTGLRKSENYINELAFVYEKDNKLVGHIMLTKKSINANKDLNCLLLAPLAVLKEYRSLGIGGDLINESLKQAKEKNFHIVFLVGDLNYYSKYGFKPTTEINIKNLNNIPDENVLFFELKENVTKDISGTIKF